MNNQEDWLNSIEGFLEMLSDGEFQHRVWVRGEGPEVSSFTEFMCGLFDDFSFDSFLDESWDEFKLSDTIHNELLHIRTRLNNYSEHVSWLDDSAIVNDPVWKEISREGAAALKRFRSERASASSSS